MFKVNNKLAINGGNKVIKSKLSDYKTIGINEKNAVKKVLQNGILSKFLASSKADYKGNNFFGGSKVLDFENKIKKLFKVKYAITVNSWTSGLTCAIGALDVNPGDEIILPTWTMCACASSILQWNCIPVFADIESETYCIDPEDVEKKITKKTKAIIAVDIFGQSSDIKKLKKIAQKYNLKIISDSAQAIYSNYYNKKSGTLADIGGFSFNCHKHIQTGEGGVLVTNKKNISQKLRLLRNHAEGVIGSRNHININKSELINMIGGNYRMGEIEAAIGIEQLKILKKKFKSRNNIAKKINFGLRNLKGIKLPKIRKNCTHSFYVYPISLDLKLLKTNRNKIYKALHGEGLECVSEGYTNLHLLPIFQNKIAYGKYGFPWKIGKYNSKISYKKGICPTAENLHDKNFLMLELCMHEFSNSEVKLLINVFKKVWFNLFNK